jgi:hypothetical protein
MIESEIIWASFVTAVAEMRAAQKNYYKVPKFYKPEAFGVQHRHETIVDEMLNDITRKPE